MKKYDAPIPKPKVPISNWPYCWPSKNPKNGEYFIHYVAFSQDEKALDYALKNKFDFSVKRKEHTFIDCIFSSKEEFIFQKYKFLVFLDDYYSWNKQYRKININFLKKILDNKRELLNQSRISAYNYFLSEPFSTNLIDNYKECLPYIKNMQTPSIEDFTNIKRIDANRIEILEDLIVSMKEQDCSEDFFLSIFNKLANLHEYHIPSAWSTLVTRNISISTNLCSEIIQLKVASGKTVCIVDKKFSQETQEKIVTIFEKLKDFPNYSKYFNDHPQSHMHHWIKQFPILKYVLLKNKIMINISNTSNVKVQEKKQKI